MSSPARDDRVECECGAGALAREFTDGPRGSARRKFIARRSDPEKLGFSDTPDWNPDASRAE